jgi:hypothetical protein
MPQVYDSALRPPVKGEWDRKSGKTRLVASLFALKLVVMLVVPYKEYVADDGV